MMLCWCVRVCVCSVCVHVCVCVCVCVFHFMTYCLEGKTNWLLKIQPYLVSGFGVVAIGNKKSKTIDLHSVFTGILQLLVN